MAKPTLLAMFPPFLHVGQACLAGYGVYVSAIAITKLRKYESASEKAAEWSDKAKHDLRKTRTTQGTGALTVAGALVVSLVMATIGNLMPGYINQLVSPAMLIATLAARAHISNYWSKDGKTVGTRLPLPGLEDYNVAQRKTEDLLRVLELLEWSWVAMSAVVGLIGY